MRRANVIFKLDEPRTVDAVRYCGDRVDARSLSEERRTVIATVTRMGTFSHPEYGTFTIDRKLLDSIVRNFDARTYGQDIFLDKDHDPRQGAAAQIKRLFVDANKLRAELEFTPFGIELATKKGYRYISAEYVEDYVDPETKEPKGALLRGAGFTIRPFVKNLDPVQLCESGATKSVMLLDKKITRLLNDEDPDMWKELVEKLQKKYGSLKLAEAVARQLLSTFEDTAKTLGDDKTKLEALYTQFENTGVKLFESIGDKEVTIKIDMTGMQSGKTLSEADVTDLVAKTLAETQQKAADDAKKLQETKDAKTKLLSDTINAAKGLSETVKAEMVKELGELVTPEMSDDQVKRLADHTIAQANKLAVATQLTAQGFYTTQSGSPHITVDDSNSIKQLQETMDQRLGILQLSDAKRFKSTGGALQKENKEFAEKALAQYDQYHGRRLHEEAKRLAAGDSVISDTAIPASWERTVVREALYSMIGLGFVDTGTLPFATSHGIPYSYRDTSAAGIDSTRVYEGGSIPQAGMTQDIEYAYPIPQKLAFLVSDELRHLTAAGHISWDAVIENQRNASRIIHEDGDRLIFNEHIQASDEFGAVAVAGEDLEPQANGTNRVFVLANFPVARPRTIRDLQGNTVGNVINPVTVTYDSVARSPYDGTGEQAAGIYYVLNYNLGEIYLVDETGAIQTPADATPYTISYSRVTNRALFDSDLPADTLARDHWDTFLRTYGLRKSEIEDTRFHMADLGLMSGTLRTSVEQAGQFGANFKRPGTDLMADGSLGRIKDVPNFKTSAPGLWMGDQRVLIGERGVTRYRMLKPWTLGQLQDQRDSNGLFTGKKQAYGDQFIMLITPTLLKRAYTTIVVYSATARVARVNP